jgi:branched-chain amino acid transport system substrate-binding protein
MALSRRAFLTLASTWSIGSVFGAGGMLPVKRAIAQPQLPQTVRIAHLSNRQGPLADMAAYALMGAQLGGEEADTTAAMFGTKVELIIDDAVGSAQIVPTTRKLIRQPGLAAIVGALDDAGTAVAAELTQQEKVVFLSSVARAGRLRGEQCHRYTFHIEPDLAMHVHAVGQWLVRNNRKRWYFIVADDALGQEVYGNASRWLQAQGGTELGRSDTAPRQRDYTPVLESLAGQEIEVIFVALMGEDLANFLGQVKGSGIAALVAGAPLDTIAMWHVGPGVAAGVWAASWYHELERFSARELNRRFMRRFGKPAEAHAWANWAAVKLVVEGVLRGGSTEAAALIDYLEGAIAFDGHKGKPLTFRDWNHQLRQPLYVLKARDAKTENSRDLFELVGELPPPTGREKSASELLDTIGEPKTESLCRLESR